MLTEAQKQDVRRRLAQCLGGEPEVRRIVVFGSFVRSEDPHDADVAVLQDSDQSYLPLAMKYRRLARDIMRVIPLDIIPIRFGAAGDALFMDEIEQGESIYESRD